jgi:FkbM family methyltransferase
MDIIDSREKVKNRAKRFIEELDNDVYILGTNKYGLCTAKWLEKKDISFGGIINDYVEMSSYEGYRVLKSEQLPEKISIINCITEGRVIIAEENIIDINPVSHVDYFALQLSYPNELKEVTFLENTKDIYKNRENYEYVFSLLSDNKSKESFENIVNFRFNRDIKFLEDFDFIREDQYFEKFLNLAKNTVFVDGGGYDGKTTEKFINLFPDYKDIYYFEPSRKLLNQSKKLLGHNHKIHFFEKGLWSGSKVLFFDDTLGSASKLSPKGNLKIETVALDEVINSRVDFIKLDIEGAEYEALKGAEGLIKKYNPAMAVCVYHNQEDFIRIPELIMSYNSKYKIYLRHYTQGVYETIMYFV